VGGGLFGREAELAMVESFLGALESGPARLVFEGEPGIGKTTLWSEAIRRAERRGLLVLSCRPAEAETKLSFAALADLVDPVADELPLELPAPQRRALEIALLRAEPESSSPLDPRAVGVALQSIFTSLAMRTPLVLVADDAQWLDRSSAGALQFALRRVGSERIGLLTFRRPGGRELEAPAGIAAGTEPVRLGPLSLSAIHELLKARLGRSLPRPLLVRVHETAGGNPFYALEIAREIVETGIRPSEQLPIPADLSQLPMRRVRRLPAATREALLVAAAAAQPTVVLISAAVGGGAGTALEEAEVAGIVEEREGGVRFSHPLYAAAVYASASEQRRRVVHRRLAEVVTGLEERARHLAAVTSAPDDEVATVIEEAAEQARARGAVTAAASLFAEASRLTPAVEAATARRRALAGAETLFDAADTGAARSLLERLLTEMASGPERSRALLLMALVHFYEDGPRPAREACLQALAGARGDPRLEAEIHLRLAFVSADDSALARRSARRARKLVAQDKEAPTDLVAAALLEDAYMRFLTGGGMAVEQVERAVRLMPPDGSTWPAQRAHALLQSWSKYTDDLTRARELLEEAVADRREHGDDYSAALTTANLAEVECWLGEWSRARAHADASAETIEQAGNPLWPAATLYHQALIAAHLGAEVEARQRALEGLQLAERAADPWIETLNLSVLGFLELSLDDPAAADEWLTRAAAAVEGMNLAEPARFRFHGDQLEAAIALGHLDCADELLLQLRRRAERAPRPWILAVSARCEALLLAARGELESALDSTGAALRDHARLPMPFELGRTLLVRGQIERRAKQKRDARESLERALAIFEQLGAPLWAKKARGELARLGLRRAAPDELTESERRVAELAASGLKNREVAAALFMSPKTVEANLARAYRKLRIRSRAELGARLADMARTPAQA
jgi:DNA-binding CsgD family transcriptional regulator